MYGTNPLCLSRAPPDRGAGTSLSSSQPNLPMACHATRRLARGAPPIITRRHWSSTRPSSPVWGHQRRRRPTTSVGYRPAPSVGDALSDVTRAFGAHQRSRACRNRALVLGESRLVGTSEKAEMLPSYDASRPGCVTTAERFAPLLRRSECALVMVRSAGRRRGNQTFDTRRRMPASRRRICGVCVSALDRHHRCGPDGRRCNLGGPLVSAAPGFRLRRRRRGP